MNDVLIVLDVELVASIKLVAECMKVVVEPTGCLGFATVRTRKAELRGKKTGVIISNGNVDVGRYSEFPAG